MPTRFFDASIPSAPFGLMNVRLSGKTLFLTAAVFHAICMSLTGCGRFMDTRPRIRFWCYGAEPWQSIFRHQIDQFNAQHPDVYVEMEAFPSLHTKLMYAFAARKAPDVTMMDTWQVSQYIGHDMVAPIDLAKLDLDPDDYYACGLDAWKRNGRYYGIPLNLNSAGATLLYNVDHLKAAGIPVPPRFESWEALFEAAQKLTKRDRHGNIIRAGFSTRAWEFLGITNIIQGLGGEFFYPEEQRIVFDSPIAKQAIALWLTPLLGDPPTDSGDLPRPSQGLFQGSVSMTILDTDMIAKGRAEFPDTPIGSDMIPKAIRKGDPAKGQFLSFGPWAMCISRFTENTALCEKLMKFLHKPENRMDYLTQCMAMPERKSLAESPYYTDPHQDGYVYRTILNDASTWRFAGHLGQINKIMWQIFGPEIQELAAGKRTLDETAKSVTDRCTRAVREFYEP